MLSMLCCQKQFLPIACDCNPAGSIDSECNDMTGQCQCKANVDPSIPDLKCSQCRDNFFNLSEANPLGCTGTSIGIDLCILFNY